MKTIYIALCFSAALLLAGCAKLHVNKGNDLFEQLAYAQAIDKYKIALEKDEDHPEAMKMMAESYYQINNTSEAEYWYWKTASAGVELDSLQMLHYARVLKSNQKYDEAKTWYEKYLAMAPGDTVARKQMLACDSIDVYKADSALYNVKKLDAINSTNSDFGPAFYEDGIVFASDRPGSSLSEEASYTGMPFLDLYYAQRTDTGFTSAMSLSGYLNSKYHEGPATFNGDGTKIFITRSNYYNDDLGESEEDFNNIMLYTAARSDSEWVNMEPFKYNDDAYSLGQASVSKDGKYMVYISDMPGGQGGTDLYISESDAGSWTVPKNLGTGLNTAGDEMFPFLFTKEDTMLLYFASDGHPGMGGLDIYSSYYDGKQWSHPAHVSYPINSSKDDFGFIMNEEYTKAYISSSRDTDNGTDNLYEVDIKALHFKLEGIVVYKSSQEPAPDTEVELTNLSEDTVLRTMTDKDGKFEFKLDKETNYLVTANKKGFISNSRNISTKNKKESDKFYAKLELADLVEDQIMALDNILYDFDSWAIRPEAAASLNRLVRILQDDPEVKIQLNAHTDSRGTETYNIYLSKKRAEAAAEHIISKGVDRDRIIARGFGESQPLEDCNKYPECPKDRSGDCPCHQKNRRTEFKVTAGTKTAEKEDGN